MEFENFSGGYLFTGKLGGTTDGPLNPNRSSPLSPIMHRSSRCHLAVSTSTLALALLLTGCVDGRAPPGTTVIRGHVMAAHTLPGRPAGRTRQEITMSSDETRAEVTIEQSDARPFHPGERVTLYLNDTTVQLEH